MLELGLDDKHRDKNGEIGRKHGNILIRTLRVIYGADFAPGCDANAKLSDCLQRIDEHSLSQIVEDAVGKTKRSTESRDDGLAVVERLVSDGKLIAIPPGGTAKPRRVAEAALHDGGEILLYLSRATTEVSKD